MKNILFVCSDNLTRSLIAEKVFNLYVKQNNLPFKSLSAGIDTNKSFQKLYISHLFELKKIGCNVEYIERTKLDQSLVDIADIIVAMAHNHIEYIKEKFNVDVYLFNKILDDVDSSIEIDWMKDDSKIKLQLEELVNNLYENMPKFIKNIEKIT